jgi:hypothetical protein
MNNTVNPNGSERDTDYRTLDTDTLLQWYANARSTSGCGGRHKGFLNDALQEKYALELRKRGVLVYKNVSEFYDTNFTCNVEIPKGIFNGIGTY